MKKAVIAIVITGLVGIGGYGVYHHFFEKAGDEAERVSSSGEDAVYVNQVSQITGYGSGNGLVQRYGGEVVPQEILEVKLESERTVKECFVKEGDEVKEGQRLFVYDTQEDEDKIAQAEIDIEKAKGEIELSEKEIAENEKARAKANSDEQLAYTTAIMTSQTAIKQSEYEIKTKELEIKNMKERIADATVTCDMDGIVQKINDNTGSSSGYSGYDSEGDSAVYIKILSAGDYRIKGSVNEHNLEDLQLLYDIGAQISVVSRVDNTKTWTGTISEIKTDQKEEENNGGMMYYGGMGNAGSSSYTFYVELENSEDLILGQHVYMEEKKGEKKEGLWLEEYYLVQEDDKAYVWAADSKNILEKREVTLGEYDDSLMKYEITEGLDAEDYIAFPQEGLENGRPVIYNEYAAGGMDMGGADMGDAGMDMDDMDMGGADMDMGDMDMGGMDEPVFDADEDMMPEEMEEN